MTQPTKRQIKRYDQYADDIREAEAHVANAKAWLRKARKGKPPEDYCIEDALAEAGVILHAACDP